MKESNQSIYSKFVRIGCTVVALCFGVLLFVNVAVIVAEGQQCENEFYKPSGVPWDQYSAPIKNALAVLNRVRPDQVQYLRQKRISIVLLEHEAFYHRFGNSRAQTENRSAIYVTAATEKTRSIWRQRYPTRKCMSSMAIAADKPASMAGCAIGFWREKRTRLIGRAT